MPEVPVEELLPRPRPPLSMAERVQRRRQPSVPGTATIAPVPGLSAVAHGPPVLAVPSPSALPSLLAVPVEWVRWFGIGRLVAIAVSVALVVAGATWLLAPPPPPVEASLPFTPGATTSIAGAAGGVGGEPPPSASVVVATPMVTAGAQGAAVVLPVDIVVHVAGAVVAPGIHRLPATARVADAVAAAGGPTADAHTDAINLAAVVHDGDRVHVPRISEGLTVPAGVTAGSTAIAVPGNDASAPVAINIATTEQLDTLPGVGPATAAAIVAHREANGPFASIDALADVRGIGPAKLETLRSFVTL